MSIVETYKNEFRIITFDEDIQRSDKNREYLKKQGFNVTAFNSRGLLQEALKQDLPHVLVMYYQPLNMNFRELLDRARKASSEMEIVLLGSKEFWPGISKLIQSGLANDFWSWPAADEQELSLRLGQLIEKYIYKFIAEQRSEETAKIIARLDAEKEAASFKPETIVDNEEFLSSMGTDYRSESQIVEEFIAGLKDNFPNSEFVFFKNYASKDQLLVTRTSFSSENYFRGQSIPFSATQMKEDRGAAFNRVRQLIEETFNCDDFAMQPVELGESFYGMIMAVNFESHAFLQRAARYLSMAMRNYTLESSGQGSEVDNDIEMSVSKAQLPLVISREVSRGRRLKSPVSVIVSHLEYIGDGQEEVVKAFELIKTNLRSYDVISKIGDNQVAIVLPHCSYEDAAIKAESIRRQLVARGLKSQNTALRLCFGVSEFPALSVDSDSLMVDAKRACSQVMVSGKNKVCLYTAPEDFSPEFNPAL